MMHGANMKIDIPIVFLIPFRSILQGVILLHLTKEQAVTTKVWISCSTTHSRHLQQKDVKLSASHSVRFTLRNVTPSTPWTGCLGVLRIKLGALKRVKSPKPNSFNISLLNSIKQQPYDTTRHHHLVSFGVFLTVHLSIILVFNQLNAQVVVL